MKRAVLAAMATGVVVFTATWASARKWTSSDGRFAVEAELVGVADGKVTLKKSGGAKVAVPLDRLSDADRRFIAGLQKTNISSSVSYVNDVRPFLDKCCLACHKTRKARGGYKCETYADLLKVGKKGAIVVPGDPDRSRLIVTHKDGKPHPDKKKGSKESQEDREDKNVKAPKPTAQEMAKVAAWIKAGAKDDSARQQ